MGAWGMGVFDDDTSCDLLCEAMESKAADFVRSAIKNAKGEYLEYEACHAIIVSGVLVDSILNGTRYETQTDGYDEWLSKQDKGSVEKYRSALRESLRMVLSDKSELNELWTENEVDYPVWKSNIEFIIKNLGG